jgi:undecaprenyl-diphosphatase
MLKAIERLDLAVFQWLRSTYHSPFLDALMAGISDVARGGALWIGLAFLLTAMSPRRWPSIVQVMLAVVVSFALTDLAAKPWFNRARPFEMHANTRVYGYRPTTRSLPSGHAATSMGAAFVLTRVVPEVRLILWALAGLVALSRVYLGVHYPADVVAGCVLGLAVGVLVVGGRRWPFKRERVDASPGHRPSHEEPQ